VRRTVVMKRVFVLAVVLMMLMLVAVQFSPVASAGSEAGDSVEQAILKLEQTWLAAVKDSKPEEATLLFADDAVFTNADGTSYSKADELNSINKVKWETAEDSDTKVIQHGNTVIVTGTFQGKGKDDGGKKVEVTERWTDVWMNTAHNGWQVVASQSSPLKK
jgi:ketosteroid isomerase-like protein